MKPSSGDQQHDGYSSYKIPGYPGKTLRTLELSLCKRNSYQSDNNTQERDCYPCQLRVGHSLSAVYAEGREPVLRSEPLPVPIDDQTEGVDVGMSIVEEVI